jgi:hypothetical protein
VTDANDLPGGNAKNVTVDLPAGFAGSLPGIPACGLADFSNLNCPASTQVGTATEDVDYPGVGPFVWTSGVYNLVPNPGETAKLGFAPLNALFEQAVVSVRPGDSGLRTTLQNAVDGIPFTGESLTLWGVPADPSHDPQRGDETNFHCYNAACAGGGASAGVTAVPFLSNPTQCGVPLAATLSMDSWEEPDAYLTASSSLGAYTGCDRLSFYPSLSVQPTVTQADSPSGYTVDLKLPQAISPTGLATADLRKAVVTLPAGVALSPSAADGLQACTDAQVGLGTSDPPACPAGSTLGTATLTTPSLPDQLTGGIYLAGPDSGPITGPPYRIFLTLSGDGVMVKLAGTVTPDPVTGQLTTTFDDNPQLPFSELELVFKDGPRAPLVNPSTCGTFTTTSDLEPWSAPFSGPDATPSDSFNITGCADPNTFAPSFSAGTINPQAGAYSPFTLTFSRSDSDQIFSRLTAKLPPGVAAKLAGVPLCSDANANAGTCPAASQVGTVEAASGPGSHPFWLPGKAFLTGPYKGGPYGLAVEIPAIAGPFNLGVVVVRNSIHIDPTTAQVTAVSDPFPTIIGGIPIQLRTVNVDLNRPGFMLNPTSCDVMSIAGRLTSTGGKVAGLTSVKRQVAHVRSRFQVGGCASLKFTPKLNMKLLGKGTRSGEHPTLVSTLTQPFKGRLHQANIRSARVTLPLSLALDPNNSQHVCGYDVAKAVHGGKVGCPKSTIVGTAVAKTPLLSKPLSGKVYLVQGIRFSHGHRIRTLPTLLIPLRGQIALDLRAQTSVDKQEQLVTTFPTIPDAAVSKFTLNINGGSRGLLVITGRGRNICPKPQIAGAVFNAHSGAQEILNPTISKPGCHK